jgi:hypothetical protein
LNVASKRGIVYSAVFVSMGFFLWMAFLRALPDMIRFDRVQQDLHEINKVMPSTPINDPWGRAYKKIDMGDQKHAWVSLGVNGYFEGFGGDDIWIETGKDEWIQRLYKNSIWKHNLIFLLGMLTGWLLRVVVARPRPSNN